MKGLAALLFGGMLFTQSPSDLEHLFGAQDLAPFFEAAKPRAAQGDAEALFLLGKAYHLGKGVEEDRREALRLYALAAEKNHVRALHNLGLLEMEFHRPQAAEEHLKRALALGLKLPTLHTLGRLYDLPSLTYFDGPESLVLARDHYYQAYEAGYGPVALDDATAAAVKAMLAPKGREGEGAEARHQVLRDEALRLGHLGADLKRPRCIQNLAALYYYEKDYTAALPWAKQGAELGQPTSLHLLALLYEGGLAVEKDAAVALDFHERAAVLGQEDSRRAVESHWQYAIKGGKDQAALEGLRDHLVALRKQRPEDADFLHEPLSWAEGRLVLLRELERNAKEAPKLPPGPVHLRLELYDMPPEEGGIPEWNLEWYVHAVGLEGAPDLDAPLGGILAKGRLDKKGRPHPSMSSLKRMREALDQGLTLVFGWPGQRRTLRVIPGQAKGLDLVLGSVVND